MATYYSEPFKSFKFLVEIEKLSGSVIAGAFSGFSGIRMRVDVMRGRVGTEKRGVMGNTPGLTTYDNVTLTGGVIGDNDLMEWIQSVTASHDAPPTGKDMRRSITIVALTDQNQRGVEWKLLNCLPVGYSTAQLNAGKSGILTESVEFAIEGFKRTTNSPEGK